MGRFVVVAFAVMPLGLLGVAHAEEQPLIAIPVDTVLYGAPGSEQLLASRDVPAGLIGEKCTVKAIGKNNDSVHPNSDLLVRSGRGLVTVFDVERESGGTTEADGKLTLGPQVTVSVRFGPDLVSLHGTPTGAFSGGGTVTIDCSGSGIKVGGGEARRATPAPAAADSPAVAEASPAQATPAQPRFTG